MEVPTIEQVERKPFEDDGLAADAAAQHSGGVLHGIGAVGDDNARGRGGFTAFQNELAAGIGHLQAVDHHEGFDGEIEAAAAQLEHVGDVSLLEKQFAGELVVRLVEGAAGHEDLDALRIHAVWRGGHTVPSWHKLRFVQAPYSEINPMRGMRWLLLVVIAAVLCGVVLTYLTKKKAIQAQVLPPPQDR